MSTYLPGTTHPHPTIVVLLHGEPYTYESSPDEAETTAQILIDDMGNDESDVDIVADITPCRIERSSLGSTFICAECGTYCACTVCAL